MIPKIVHQTWYDNKLPKIFQEISNENKRINNDFEFKLWRDDDNEKVIENIKLAYKAILKELPQEKENVKDIMIKLTMGKPVKVEL